MTSECLGVFYFISSFFEEEWVTLPSRRLRTGRFSTSNWKNYPGTPPEVRLPTCELREKISTPTSGVAAELRHKTMREDHFMRFFTVASYLIGLTYFYINVHTEQVFLYDCTYYFNLNTCKCTFCCFFVYGLHCVLPWELPFFCDVIQLLLVKYRVVFLVGGRKFPSSELPGMQH